MMLLGELTEIIGGRLTQNPDLEISGAASISRATASDITFVSSPKYYEDFLNSPAIAAVIGFDANPPEKACLIVDDVTQAFVEIAERFKPTVQRTQSGISDQAIVSPKATIHEEACIHPGAVIMDNVQIGSGTIVYPNVTIMENCILGKDVQVFPNSVLYENTIVGDRSILHAGVVLGAFGFGYQSNTGRHVLSAQIGNVVIAEDVEIGANTTIDRGTYDSTVIGAGTKIDNLVMVGHNCMIGEHNLLCSQVGIAGSCSTGDYVIMGGQVGLADHLNIGSHVSIGAKSGLMHDVESNQRIFGIPARPARTEMQIQAVTSKLPELRRTVKKLSKQLDQLNDSEDNGSRAA
ncbi:MAG: UDP-3-O-(3-hydroxymyristoyl)glucosamine N-acyltransferase [Mariniblastus sp.]|nr:UDP-3-O-(3-hydroxymyristoyl)glucosamine N-acyltransferase [Mariniblastus sp.]